MRLCLRCVCCADTIQLVGAPFGVFMDETDIAWKSDRWACVCVWCAIV